MTLHIEKETDKQFDPDYESIIKKIVETALEFEDCPYESEVSVILTDNEEIAKINCEHRDIDKPTDVLSFPMVQYDTPSDFDQFEEIELDAFHPETGELMLGDIIISVEKVMEQAAAYNHSPERELAFLTAHSMLHLFGYDHIDEADRKTMEAKQEEILRLAGYTRED